MTAELTLAEKAAAILAPVEYAAVFVPASRAPDMGWDDDRSTRIHWQCTFKVRGVELTTPFAQGCGHIPGYNALNHRLVIVQEAIKNACETGRYTPAKNIFEHFGFLKRPLEAPKRDDVLSCLLSDGSAIDAGSFEDWCAEFGYDTDSRKAEKTYRTCVDTGLTLRRMFGDEALTVLRDHYSELGL